MSVSVSALAGRRVRLTVCILPMCFTVAASMCVSLLCVNNAPVCLHVEQHIDDVRGAGRHAVVWPVCKPEVPHRALLAVLCQSKVRLDVPLSLAAPHDRHPNIAPALIAALLLPVILRREPQRQRERENANKSREA